MALSDEDKEELRKELAEARRILKEDKVLAHNALMDERWKRVHGEDPPKVPEGAPPAPDPKNPPNDPTPKKKGFWWGDALESE